MSAPLRLTRLAALALSTAFGIIAMGLGINALAKSNHQKDTIRKNAPLGASISINTSDVFSSGVVNTVVCGLIAATSFTALVLALLGSATRRATLLPAHILAFLSLWLFAGLVPFTDFVANRQARVSASLDGVPLPESIIQAVQAQLGVTGVYHQLSYLRLATIFPWIALLFAVLSAVLSYTAARGAAPARYPLSAGVGPAEAAREEDEKPKEEMVGVREV